MSDAIFFLSSFIKSDSTWEEHTHMVAQCSQVRSVFACRNRCMKKFKSPSIDQ